MLVEWVYEAIWDVLTRRNLGLGINEGSQPARTNKQWQVLLEPTQHGRCFWLAFAVFGGPQSSVLRMISGHSCHTGVISRFSAFGRIGYVVKE